MDNDNLASIWAVKAIIYFTYPRIFASGVRSITFNTEITVDQY